MLESMLADGSMEAVQDHTRWADSDVERVSYEGLDAEAVRTLIRERPAR